MPSRWLIAVLLGAASPALAAPPASAPARDAAPARDKASLTLDKIPPVVAKPKNPPDADKLSPRAKDAVIEGEKLLGRGDYPGALSRLDRAVGFQPDSPRIRRALAMTYLGLANRGKALANLRRALAKAPDDLEAQLLMAKLAEAQNDSLEARQALRTALKCTGAKPGNSLAAEALLLLGDLLADEGYSRAALDCYTRLADQIDTHGRRYMLRAKLKPLVLRPDKLMAKRGKLLLELGQAAKAADLLLSAHRRDRTDVDKAHLALRALIEGKRFAEAEKLLVEMADYPALQESLPPLIISLCRAAKDKAMPVRLWKLHHKKAPNDVAVAVALARVALKLKSPEGAEQILGGILGVASGNVEVVRAVSSLRAMQGKNDKALLAWESYVRSEPNPAEGVKLGMADLADQIKDRQYHKTFAASLPADASAPARYIAGMFAIIRNDGDLGEAQLRKALAVDPKFSPAYEALIELFLVRKQLDKLRTLLQEIPQALPGTNLAFYARGRLAYLEGKLPDAIDQLKRAYGLNDKHLPTLMALAEVYARAGKPREAEEALNRAMALVPQRREVYQKLFDQYIQRGLHDKAEGIIRIFEKQGAPPELIGRLKVELLLARKDADGAKAALTALAKAGHKGTGLKILALRAELELWRGPLPKAEFFRALGKAEKLFLDDPQNASARKVLSQLLTSAGDPRVKEVRQAWARLHAKADFDADVTRQYAAALIRVKDYKQAEKVLTKHLAEEAGDEWSQRRLIDALVEQGKHKEAAAKLTGWLATRKDDSSAFWYRLRLLGVQEDAKQYAQAQKVLDDWIKSAARDSLVPTLQTSKIQLYGDAKEFDKAVAYTEKVVAGAGGRADMQTRVRLRQSLVLALMKGEQYDRALKLLRPWAQGSEEPEVMQYRLLEMHVLGKAKRLDELTKACTKWIEEIDANVAHADGREALQGMVARETMISALLSEAKRIDLAIAALRQWLKAWQGKKLDGLLALEIVRYSRETLVRLLLSDDKYDEALALLKKYLKTPPAASAALAEEAREYDRLRGRRHEAELLNLQATALGEKNKFDAARAALEKALSLVPDDEGFNNNLGYMLADRGIDLLRAETMIRRALRVRKSELAYMDSLGWVLYKQDKLRESAAEFAEVVRRSAEEDEEHPVMCDHAGDVFYRLGWTALAQQYWTRALALAKKEERKTEEIRLILKNAPGKIDAVKKRKPAAVAPLGEKRPAETEPI